MAKTKISEYDSTSSNNTDIDSINIAEGCAPSGINNAIREVMSHLKDFQTGVAGDDLTVGGNFSVTGTVTIPDNAISGDKVEGGTINAITINTLSANPTLSAGTANGVAYLNGSKVLTSGSALTYNNSEFTIGDNGTNGRITLATGTAVTQLLSTTTGFGAYQTFETKASEHRWFIGGSSEQMRLTSTGLGIGTSSPSAKLDVKGGTTISTLAGWNTLSNSMFELANPAVRFGIGYDSSDQVLLQAFDSSNAARSLALQVYGGNVGIGTSSPSHRLSVAGSTGTIASFTNGATADFSIICGASATSLNAGGSNVLAFQTGGSERARIDSSGTLLVGTTDTNVSGYGAVLRAPNGEIWLGHQDTVSGWNYSVFKYNGSIIGSIVQNGTTGVSYNTSSDYRLKHDIQPMTGALAKVQQLKPVTYKWNADDSQSQGFIAHELQEVVPDAVTGEKDAVNDDGSPKYQGIDTSFLVATLTAALQEQQAIIESLTARISALEGN
jgi:hypothetical protein